MEIYGELKMKLTKKILSISLALSMLFLSACNKSDSTLNKTISNQDPNKISFVLDWTPNTNHTGIYVAIEKGYYAEEGLEVNIIQPQEDGAESTVASGQAQFGVSFQENLAIALSNENPLPITAVATIIDHNTSGIISLAEKNIQSFKDLEGKKYATFGLPVEQAILKYAVEQSGGDFSKVELVPHSGADAISLLNSGVDAVWVYEAWDNIMADLQGVNYNFIPFVEASSVLDFYTPIIIANDDFIKNNNAQAEAFMRATEKGYNFAINNPEEAGQILLKSVPELNPELVNESQTTLALYYTAEKESWGTIDEQRWETFFNFMYGNNLIPIELGTKGFTNEFLGK